MVKPVEQRSDDRTDVLRPETRDDGTCLSDVLRWQRLELCGDNGHEWFSFDVTDARQLIEPESTVFERQDPANSSIVGAGAD